jgi:hypothetical protein
MIVAPENLIEKAHRLIIFFLIGGFLGLLEEKLVLRRANVRVRCRDYSRFCISADAFGFPGEFKILLKAIGTITKAPQGNSQTRRFVVINLLPAFKIHTQGQIYFLSDATRDPEK